jgi:AcrR family transcriptional regulator
MDREVKPNRNERRRQRTRELILHAADVVFRAKGVDNATVNDITDEADVAYGTFYNHFRSMDEIVEARAELSIQRVSEFTDPLLKHAGRVELLPCIGARIIMRVLIADPAMRWMVERPYVFVDEISKVAAPMMRGAEAKAVAEGRLKPVGGHECWLRMYPWLLLAEIQEALKSGDILFHEEQFAYVSLRFLGIDDALAATLVEESRLLVGDAALNLGEGAPAAG